MMLRAVPSDPDLRRAVEAPVRGRNWPYPLCPTTPPSRIRALNRARPYAGSHPDWPAPILSAPLTCTAFGYDSALLLQGWSPGRSAFVANGHRLSTTGGCPMSGTAAANPA